MIRACYVCGVAVIERSEQRRGEEQEEVRPLPLAPPRIAVAYCVYILWTIYTSCWVGILPPSLSEHFFIGRFRFL